MLKLLSNNVATPVYYYTVDEYSIRAIRACTFYGKLYGSLHAAMNLQGQCVFNIQVSYSYAILHTVHAQHLTVDSLI